jgi:hypothetical protein
MRDALLSAVVAKLPPPGAPWPVDAREAWFVMMRNAVDVAYGPEALPPTREPGARGEVATSRQPQASLPVSAPVPAAHFHIDPDGNARRDNAVIDPEEIPPGAILHDYRRQPVNEDTDPVMWKTHGSKPMALPPAVVIRAATELYKGRRYNGEAMT